MFSDTKYKQKQTKRNFPNARYKDLLLLVLLSSETFFFAKTDSRTQQQDRLLIYSQLLLDKHVDKSQLNKKTSYTKFENKKKYIQNNRIITS